MREVLKTGVCGLKTLCWFYKAAIGDNCMTDSFLEADLSLSTVRMIPMLPFSLEIPVTKSVKSLGFFRVTDKGMRIRPREAKKYVL